MRIQDEMSHIYFIKLVLSVVKFKNNSVQLVYIMNRQSIIIMPSKKWIAWTFYINPALTLNQLLSHMFNKTPLFFVPYKKSVLVY